MAPAAKITSRAEMDDLSLREVSGGGSSVTSLPSAKGGDVAAAAAGTTTDADPSKPPPFALVSDIIFVISAAAALAAATGGLAGKLAAPKPLDAILPSIQTACSCTAASTLDNKDTIMGTASACRRRRRCEDVERGVWGLHPAVTWAADWLFLVRSSVRFSDDSSLSPWAVHSVNAVNALNASICTSGGDEEDAFLCRCLRCFAVRGRSNALSLLP